MLGVIGDVAQDVVVTLKEEIRHATDTRCDILVQRGGSAANTAAFAGPRHPTRFIGCVGNDLAGYSLTKDLESRGVDVKMQTAPDVPTATIVIMIGDDGERNMFPDREASSSIRAIEDDWLEDLEVLHITGYSLQAEPTKSSVLEACAKVRLAGGLISLDVSSTGVIAYLGLEHFKDMVRELNPDFISANRDETDLLELCDDDEAGDFLSELGPNTVVLARAGADDTKIFRGTTFIATVPVVPADVVRDMTGAGDSFNAAFLTSYLDKGDLIKAVEDAHALARKVLAFSGASEGD